MDDTFSINIEDKIGKIRLVLLGRILPAYTYRSLFFSKSYKVRICSYLVSINDLVKEEAQRQIDLVIEAIPVDKDRFSTPIGKAILQYENITDFLLGYEYGHVAEACALYYKDQVERTGRRVTEIEMRQVLNDISPVIHDRLPEIRQAILRSVTPS